MVACMGQAHFFARRSVIGVAFGLCVGTQWQLWSWNNLRLQSASCTRTSSWKSQANAMKDDKPARVGVLYDFEVRSHWANEMAKLGRKFVLGDHVKVKCILMAV